MLKRWLRFYEKRDIASFVRKGVGEKRKGFPEGVTEAELAETEDKRAEALL
jgi:hypothetical protein